MCLGIKMFGGKSRLQELSQSGWGLKQGCSCCCHLVVPLSVAPCVLLRVGFMERCSDTTWKCRGDLEQRFTAIILDACQALAMDLQSYHAHQTVLAWSPGGQPGLPTSSKSVPSSWLRTGACSLSSGARAIRIENVKNNDSRGGHFMQNKCPSPLNNKYPDTGQMHTVCLDVCS